MLKEVARVCKKNAVVVLREHDVITKEHQALTDLEHMVYSAVEDCISMKQFHKYYYAKYMSAEKWRELFKSYGFISIKSDLIAPNPTRRYFSVMMYVE